MTPAFAVVPPMSKAMALSRPSVWHSACVPITPAAGPDSSMRTHCVCACSLRRGRRSIARSGTSRRKPALADMLVDLADVAPHLRADIGVGRDRRAALELAVLLRQLVRRGDEHAGMALAAAAPWRAPRARALAIAVDEHDGGRFDAELVQLVAPSAADPSSSSGVAPRRRRARAPCTSKRSARSISGTCFWKYRL